MAPKYYDFFIKDLKIKTSFWIHLSSSHCALFTCVPCQLVQAAFGGPTQRQPSWTWSKQVRINPINFPWNCTFPRQGNAKFYTTSTTNTQMNLALVLSRLSHRGKVLFTHHCKWEIFCLQLVHLVNDAAYSLFTRCKSCKRKFYHV